MRGETLERPITLSETTREVAAALLLGTCGRVLLQQRDDVPGILYPGMIGLFGGHREGGETFLACVQREVEEETGFRVAPECFEEVVTLVIGYPDGSTVKGAYFLVRDVPTDRLVITEGSLVPVAVGELAGLLHRMTPSACFTARLFLLADQQGHR
jgi:8-oxo-dGTP diphosphatase